MVAEDECGGWQQAGRPAGGGKRHAQAKGAAQGKALVGLPVATQGAGNASPAGGTRLARRLLFCFTLLFCLALLALAVYGVIASGPRQHNQLPAAPLTAWPTGPTMAEASHSSISGR